MIQIEIAKRVRQPWIDVGLLRRVALSAANREGFRTGTLSIAILGARAMAMLHARTQNDATPTDVLTFDLGTDLRRSILDGEIAVCADVAKAVAIQKSPVRVQSKIQSRRGGTKSKIPRLAAAELALYVCHGVLHLAGYNDVTRSGYRKMHERENELLAQLGLGQAFGDIID